MLLAEVSNGQVIVSNSEGSRIAILSESNAVSVDVQGLELAIKLDNGMTQIYKADGDEYGSSIHHVRTLTR